MVGPICDTSSSFSSLLRDVACAGEYIPAYNLDLALALANRSFLLSAASYSILCDFADKGK